MKVTEQSSDFPLEKVVLGSEVISVTFAGFYILLNCMGEVDPSTQRRWQLRSSADIGWRSANDDAWEFGPKNQRCVDLVSVVNETFSSAALNNLGLEFVFSSGKSCLLKRDERSGEVGDLESYLVASDMSERLEGLWAF